jgi:hypothetical protein
MMTRSVRRRCNSRQRLPAVRAAASPAPDALTGDLKRASPAGYSISSAWPARTMQNPRTSRFASCACCRPARLWSSTWSLLIRWRTTTSPLLVSAISPALRSKSCVRPMPRPRRSSRFFAARRFVGKQVTSTCLRATSIVASAWRRLPYNRPLMTASFYSGNRSGPSPESAPRDGGSGGYERPRPKAQGSERLRPSLPSAYADNCQRSRQATPYARPVRICPSCAARPSSNGSSAPGITAYPLTVPAFSLACRCYASE